MNADMKNRAQSVILYSGDTPVNMIKLAQQGKAQKEKSFATLSTDYRLLKDAIQKYARFVPRQENGKWVVEARRSSPYQEFLKQSEIASLSAIISDIQRVGSGMGALDEGVKTHFKDIMGNPQPHLWGGSPSAAQAQFNTWAGNMLTKAEGKLNDYFVSNAQRQDQNQVIPASSRRKKRK